jgi:preprotein translocase subunit SecY
MADEEKEGKEEFITKIAKYIPAVEKPTYKQGFNTRLMWTGVALLLYLLLSYITVFGVSSTSYERFRFYEIVLGSRFGSLMTLGIGPIVTAGILLQLLVGSKILNWDMTKPETRNKFQTWDKFLAIILAFVEAAAYVLAGAVPVGGGLGIGILVILQLAAGGIIVILLDDLVSKWGFGSGISLFIAAGVGSQILVRALSPMTMGCVPGNILSCLPSIANPPSGLIWQALIAAIAGQFSAGLIYILPVLATILVFLIVVYIQDMKIDIPLVFSQMRGFGRTWSLKLLYTSNIPVILAAALIANMQLLGRIGAVQTGSLTCNFFGCYDASGNPVSGIVYYLSAPGKQSNGLFGEIYSFLIKQMTYAQLAPELLRALTYLAFLTAASTLFAIFWVNTSGMDSGSVAEQIEGIGMHIPGYRSDKKSMETVLNKYIPHLAVIGGFLIGVIAAFADFTGAIGTGTGILLTVMIIYNYYEELSNQPLDEAHPTIRKILGE